MNFKTMAAVAAAGLMSVTAAPALAGLEAVGDAQITDSWLQEFRLFDVGDDNLAFDEMRLTVVLSDSSYTCVVKNPAFTDVFYNGSPPSFTDQSAVWGQVGASTNAQNDVDGDSGFLNAIAKSDGTDFTELYFQLHISSDPSDGIKFTIDSYRDGNFVGTNTLAYVGSTPVPLPPAVWSGLAVLGGMGFMIARKRRNQILA